VDRFIAKIIIICSFLLLTAVNLFSQDFPDKEAILVKTFPIGNDLGELGLRSGSGPTAPGGLYFDKNGLFYICDNVNRRICIFDKSYNYLRSIDPSPISEARLEVDDYGNVIGYSGSAGIIKIDNSGNVLFSIYVLGEDIYDELRGDGFFIVDNMVLAYKDDGGIIGFNNPGTDYKANNRHILNTQEVIREIERNHPSLRVETGIEPSIQQRDSSSRPTVPSRQSSEYIIYENGVELSRDFDRFMTLKSQDGTGQSRTLADNDLFTLFEKYKKKRIKILRGTDIDGNIYWQLHYSIFVLNPTGIPIAAFELDCERSTTHPVISPSGDVYYMGSGKTGHYLYKYERDW
jgi:hypothetical protein